MSVGWGDPPKRRLPNSTLPYPSSPMSRKPMSRGSGLQAGVPLVRRAGQMAARRTRGTASGRPLSPAEFTPEVRTAVRKRAGRGDMFEAACEGCGTWLGLYRGEFQHRAARGSGGCRDEIVNGPANCLLLCLTCHRAAEGRDEHLGMDAAGLWIEHGTTPAYDPRNVALMLHGEQSGLLVYLAADGKGDDGTGYLLQCPEIGAEAA